MANIFPVGRVVIFYIYSVYMSLILTSYVCYIARYCYSKSSVCLALRDVDVPWAYIPGGAKKNVPNIRRCYTAVLLTDF